MTTHLVHRPTRVVRPLPAQEPLTVDAPPPLPDGRAVGGMQTLIPMAGAGVAMSMMMFLRGSAFAALGAVVMVAALAGAAILYVTQQGRAGRKRRADRERYLDYLEELRDRLREQEIELRRSAALLDPPVSHLLDVIRDGARLWERRRADPDFLRVRIGSGTLPLRPLRLHEQGTAANPTDPFMRQEAYAVIRRFDLTSGLPARIALDSAGDVSVIARSRADALTVARALLAQVAAFHAPDDVTVAVITAPERGAEWSWVRWLPHLLDRRDIGPDGPTPLLVTAPEQLSALIAADLTQRAANAAKAFRHGGGRAHTRTGSRLLVIDDAHGTVARALPTPDQAVGLPALGITVVHLLADRLHEPGDISCRVTVDGGALAVEDLTVSAPVSVRGTIDDAPAALVEGLARRMAPLRLSADSYDDGTGTPPADLPKLLGITEPTAVDVDRLWRPRSERDLLRVPIGVDPTGRPVWLDLKEPAQLGMGPHGLCVGATGSGKSELLRTLVLALGVTHPPDRLAMVLVDYKGGATFAPFAQLPHVAGLITNLASDASLIERVYTSLDGEVQRRQQMLADAGRLTDITEYALRRAELGEPDELPPMRYLLVLIDEFGELLAAKPEFIDLFLRIGRIGRSIGVHLLLASQRVEEGRMRGLETYLSYRIGLRTFSETESRTVLDTVDAFQLPPLPGNGYLKVDVTIYQRFKAAYVSGPLADDDAAELAPITGPPVRPMPLFGSVVEAGVGPRERRVRRTTGPTLLSTVTGRLAAHGERVPAIWLPPLPAAVTLDQACGGLDVTGRGVRLRGAAPDRFGLGVPVGLLDDPARQWQGPWYVDLSAGGGHLLVTGGPGTGKTTALCTVALGLAGTRTPQDVGIYGIDLLGSGLRALSGLPHVGGVAGRDDRERVRRTLDEVHAMLSQRERVFARHNVDTVHDLRSGRAAAGVLDEIGCTDVVLLVDGYGQLAAEFESAEGRVHDLLARGGRYGIHVVATARRWNEVRGAQQVAFANRVELRLTEPAESGIDGRLARGVPVNQPGRALTTEKLYAQVALARLDGLPDPATPGLAAAATMVRGAWTGPLPPPIRVLPAVLPVGSLPAPAPGTVALGRFEDDFSAATVDLFGADQHLLVLGDPGAGRSNLLRVVAHGLMRQFGPDELVFAVFDPRRRLAQLVPEPYRGGYAPNPALAQQLTAAVCKELAQREPASGGAGGRTWPRVVLLVDDYDILSASAGQPLGAFVPHVGAGQDVGLHVVMTRRVAGASRGLFEPFTLAVRESGCPGLLLSGDRSAGLLWAGVRRATLPVGRALLVRPGEPVRTVQTAYADPELRS